MIVAGAGFLLGPCLRGRAQVDELPVYEVIQSGAGEAQVKGLAGSLKLPREKLSVQRGVVSYADFSEYLNVPTRPVTDPAQLEKLKAMSRDENQDASISFEAIDFDALKKQRVLDSASALKAASAAFASAGLHLESAKAVAGNTVFAASYTNDAGAVISVERKLDTKVNYKFAAPNGIPFIGPGAQLQVAYNAKGSVIQLYYGWREVKEGSKVKIISETEARSRIARLLPAGAKIKLRLVYWCPPFDNAAAKGEPLNPTSIIPWYAYTGTIEMKDPATGSRSVKTTKERLILATDDPAYVPSIQFKVSGSGSSRVEAGVEASGGRAPYTYVWTGSNPAVLESRDSSVRYVPLARAVPREGTEFAPNETVALNEIVSVTVIDANGIAVLASQTIPVQAQPIISQSHGGGSHGTACYGCESPGEPEEWTQERVGWQQGMSNPGAGSQKFCWLGDDSWPGDYIKPSKPGTLPAKPWINGDADYSNWGINTANLVLVNGDGWPDGFTAMYPGAPQSDYNNDVNLLRPGNPGGTVQMPTHTYNVNYDHSWGPEGSNDRLYWLAGLLCECLDVTDGAGLNTHQRWGAAFGGLHIFTGFASGAAYSAGAFPKAFAEKILGVSGSSQTIKNAWFNASTDTAEGTAAAMGPITTGAVSDLNDHYIGQGSMGPSIAPANITGWWSLHQ